MNKLLAYLSFDLSLGDNSSLPIFYVLIGVGIVGALALYLLPLIAKKKNKSKDNADKD